MDLIYAGALLTIIAATGKNADAGLPGLMGGTRSVIQGTVRRTEQGSKYTDKGRIDLSQHHSSNSFST